MTVPVLLDHDHNRIVGAVVYLDGRFLVELEARPLTREEFFAAFGAVGVRILEERVDAGVARIVRAQIYEFSIMPTLGPAKPGP